MDCEKHPGRKTVGRCLECGRETCSECIAETGDVLRCPECFQKEVERISQLIKAGPGKAAPARKPREKRARKKPLREKREKEKGREKVAEIVPEITPAVAVHPPEAPVEPAEAPYEMVVALPDEEVEHVPVEPAPDRPEPWESIEAVIEAREEPLEEPAPKISALEAKEVAAPPDEIPPMFSAAPTADFEELLREEVSEEPPLKAPAPPVEGVSREAVQPPPAVPEAPDLEKRAPREKKKRKEKKKTETEPAEAADRLIPSAPPIEAEEAVPAKLEKEKRASFFKRKKGEKKQGKSPAAKPRVPGAPLPEPVTGEHKPGVKPAFDEVPKVVVPRVEQIEGAAIADEVNPPQGVEVPWPAPVPATEALDAAEEKVRKKEKERKLFSRKRKAPVTVEGEGSSAGLNEFGVQLKTRGGRKVKEARPRKKKLLGKKKERMVTEEAQEAKTVAPEISVVVREAFEERPVYEETEELKTRDTLEGEIPVFEPAKGEDTPAIDEVKAPVIEEEEFTVEQEPPEYRPSEPPSEVIESGGPTAEESGAGPSRITPGVEDISGYTVKPEGEHIEWPFDERPSAVVDLREGKAVFEQELPDSEAGTLLAKDVERGSEGGIPEGGAPAAGENPEGSLDNRELHSFFFEEDLKSEKKEEKRDRDSFWD